MNSIWKTFIAGQGAHITNDTVMDFGHVVQEKEAALDGNIITDLSNYSVLKVSGEDTIIFLQGQFTCDLTKIQEGHISFGAWCNNKGRIFTNFLIIKAADFLYLILPTELKEEFIKKLRMYVLRSRVVIEDMSQEKILLGIRGESLQPLLAEVLPGLPVESNTVIMQNDCMVLKLNDTSERFIIIALINNAQSLWTDLIEHLTPVGNHFWQLYEILSGHAWINPRTSGELLPQSINMDVLGGLSLDKGCYLGQEIIARMHFRGKIKQRMYLAGLNSSTVPEEGNKLYMHESNKSVGEIVNVFKHPDGFYRLLATIDIVNAKDDHLHIESTDEPALNILSLPYSIPE